MIRVLIAGYHGFGNCGDEAILQAMTANIRAMAKDVEITALSYNPEFTKTEYGINSVQRFNMLQVLSAIKHSDICLVVVELFCRMAQVHAHLCTILLLLK